MCSSDLYFLLRRLENLNISWCDFSHDHVKAVVDNLACSMVHLNLSGYRQNLTMEGKRGLRERHHDRTNVLLGSCVNNIVYRSK